uniref:DNA-directed RNA polymerase n=1 Tax=Timema shepardi TaxID=629360 RepID=A0A7R9ARI0_TIMSH|nr:unnamed protein product [Timema shepardi]
MKDMIVKKKKIRKPKKKYAELMEVADGSSSQRKASVTTLKSKHLSLIASEPDMNLSQLHRLKKTKLSSSVKQQTNSKRSDPTLDVADVNSSTFGIKGAIIDPSLASSAVIFSAANNPLNAADELQAFNEDNSEFLQETQTLQTLDVQLDQAYLHTKLMEELDHGEEMFLDQDNFTNLQNTVPPKKVPLASVKKSKPKTPRLIVHLKPNIKERVAKVSRIELDNAGKEESLARNLLCYLETCVSCGLLNRGWTTLQAYQYRAKNISKDLRQSDVNLYATLLHGFAGKGNLNKVKEIVRAMKESGLQLSPQCYVALFECVGRQTHSSADLTLLSDLTREMEEKGITLNDMFVKSTFLSDQREMALKGVLKLQPSFEPVIPPPDTCYSCSLLRELDKKTNEAVSFRSPGQGILTREQLKDLTKEQLDMEVKSYVRVRSIEKRSETNENILQYRLKLEEAQSHWKKIITEAFKRDMSALRSQHHTFKAFRHINLYPYLRVLDTQQYTDIIMQEIRRLAEGSETFSPTTRQLYRDLGNQVQSRHLIRHKQYTGVLDKLKHLYEEYCDWYLDPSCSSCTNTRQRWQELIHQHQDGPSMNSLVMLPTPRHTFPPTWLASARAGGIWLSLAVHLLPAFYTLFRHQGHMLMEEVKPHPVLARLFRGAAQEELVFDVTNVPMLTPPLPWSSMNSGGYLLARANLIRLPFQAVQQWHRLKEAPEKELYPSLDSLNQLGAVPWTINEPLLDVITEVFNSGGSQRLDIPEPPSACPPPGAINPEMSKMERFEAYRQRMALRRQKAEMYSLWCDTLYRLSLANHFRKRVFWLPHNMDFRGRVYPCPPHLNHLGSDMARAIICFFRGEPLGPKGMDWLKIHLVNLTGLKKKNSESERLQYAQELIPDILDSADRPLTGDMWWAKSECPWQTLAVCMEIARAMRSGDPEAYVCHFPVHQDGSCNGLQHYAALGRDSVGAESVNLTPAVKPQDVYSRVAALVEREREKDALEGLELAKVLEGFVRRKVIKQTVMTTVYGVTRFGARLQIAKQLKDIEDFPKEFVWPASTYLVMKTFESLQEMFTSTKEIQDWFTECARLISQVCGQNVEWVTPLGFPVVQPYNRFNKLVAPQLQAKKLQEHYNMDMFERPNVVKQKNAFPPNYIHSLDSTHMMLTSLFCERRGITFVSVHDCFWTHPSAVDVMNRICREQFVALHSQPILEDLSRFMVKKFSYSDSELTNDGSVVDMSKRKLNQILTRVPSKGDLDITNVLNSVYFFS